MNYKITHKITHKITQINSKDKRLFFNSFFSFIIMGLSLIISLLMLPSYIKFFPNQKILGLWFTALSVLSWILTFDLGIGNGLRNKLVEAFAENDNIKARKYISSAYILVGLVVLVISISCFFIFKFVNWNSVFNVPSNVVNEILILKVVRIIFLGIMLQFFLRLINSIMYALQQSFIPNLLTFISSLILLIYILIAKDGTVETNLINLAYANIIAANLPITIATIILFAKKIKYAFPSFSYYDSNFAKNILRLGGAFFWIQIMYMIMTNTKEFLITWTKGSEFVVEFKIYNSIFSIVGSIFLLVLTPVWSEVTEAHVKKEFLWIKQLYKKLILLGVLAVLVLIVLIFILQFLVDFWLKKATIEVNYFHAIMFAFSMMLFIWSSILSTVTGGIGKLKNISIFTTLGAILTFPLSLLFTYFTNSWIGVIIANVLALLPLCIAQTLWLKNYFKKMSHV